MSTTIDNRVVEMNFENSGFEKNILKSQDSLTKFNDALNKTDGGNMNLIGDIAGGVMGKFSALQTIATGALLRIGSQALATGQQLLKSLTLDQVTAGFGEYELKINSIKTMLASGKTAEGLPVTLELVNKKLAELNEYSDKTIYSFSDMTSNIGKFTNAGVNLDLAVASIQGISNAAALAGASSADASRAMYNFSQALSAGYVKLIDWKSIENANMATVDFKTQLLEAAVAAGTLEKTADGMYKVLSGNGMDSPISATKNFNDSLQEQWMTSEVLTATLSKYADANTEIGAKATEAATKVRTFTQLMETTKEALGSGWATTFEHIFGNFDEATNLWSNISKGVGSFIQETSDARNETMKLWKEANIFRAIFSGIETPAKSLYDIVKVIGEAFKEIIPPKTKQELSAIAAGIFKFLRSLTLTDEQLKNIKTIFKGLFSALKLGWDAISGVIKGLVTGIKQVFGMIPKSESGGILGFFAKLGEWFLNLSESAKKAGIFVAVAKAIANSIVWVATKIGEGITALRESKFFTETLKNILEGFKSWADNLPSFEGIGKFFERFTAQVGTMKGISTEGLDKLHDKLSDFFDKIANKLEPAWNFIKGIFDKLSAFFSQTWETEGLSGFLKIAGAFAVGGAGLGIMDFFKSLAGIGGNIGDLTGIFGSLKETLGSFQSLLDAKKLTEIALAIGILAVSLLVLSLIPEDKLISASLAITALFANLGASMMILDKSGGGATKAAFNMVLLSTAVLLLAGALKILETVDPKAILAMGAVIAELIISTQLASKKGGGALIAMAGAMDGLAIAVLGMAAAATIFSKMKPEELKQGLTAISILMAEMLIFSVVMGQAGTNALGIAAAGLAMGIIAIALLELVGVVAVLSTMSIDNLVKSLSALAALMGIMALGMMALANPQVLFGAAAMLVVAAALAIFVPSLVMLGSLPWEVIGKGLLAIAGIFVVLGLAGLVLAPVLPAIFGLGLALLAIGGGAMLAGAGLMLFGTGLGLVAAAGAGAIAVLIFGIREFLKLLPFAGTQLGLGLMSFIKIIINNAPLIGQAMLTLLQTALTTLGAAGPMIITTVMNLITNLLIAFGERLPEFIQAGFDLILAFLQGIANNIQPLIAAGADILINFMNGIAEKIPEIIAAGVNIITAFLEGVSKAIPDVVDAAFQMIIDVINGIATSIETNTPLLLTAVGNLATAFLDGLKTYFKVEEGQSLAGFIIEGLVNGITNGVSSVVNAAIDLGGKVLAGLADILGIESPSTETRAFGKYFDKGFIDGIGSLSRKVVGAAENLGTGALDGIKKTIGGLSGIVGKELHLDPVITPVLDLAQVRADANEVNGLMSNKLAYGLAFKQAAFEVERSNATLPGSEAATTREQNISFVQQNYSPKALSAIEIYRQTKNQLAMLKGVVNP